MANVEEPRFVYKDSKPWGPRVLDRKYGQWKTVALVEEMAMAPPDRIILPKDELFEHLHALCRMALDEQGGSDEEYHSAKAYLAKLGISE